jgi:hypothetical protein
MRTYFVYVASFCSLIERPLRRSIQGSILYSTSYDNLFVILGEAKDYSPFTIHNSRL